MNVNRLAVFSFHLAEKLTYFGVVPHLIIRQGGLTVPLFFLFHFVPMRLSPAWGGYIADRASPVTALLIGFAAEASGIILLVSAPLTALLYLGGAIVGVGAGILSPAVQVMLAADQPNKAQRMRFSYHYLLINVAALLGTLVVWPSLGRTSSAFLLCPALCTLWIARGSRNAPRRQQNQHAFFVSFTAIYGQVRSLLLLLALSSVWAGASLVFSAIPTLGHQLGAPVDKNVWLAWNSGTIVALLPLAATFLAQRSGDWKLIASGSAVMAIALGMIALAPSSFVLTGAVIVLSIGELLAVPAIHTYLNAISVRGKRAQYLAIIWVAGAIGCGSAHVLFACFPKDPRLVCVVMSAALGAFVSTYTLARRRERI